MQLQSMILNRQHVPTAKKFNLIKGLKTCVLEMNEFFGLYNTHDKAWFYVPYALIAMMVLVVNFNI